MKNGGVMSLGKYGTTGDLPRIGMDSAGKSEEYQSAFLTVEQGGILNALGSMTVNTYGKVTLAGSMTVAGTLNNKGTIDLVGTGVLSVETLSGTGSVSMDYNSTIAWSNDMTVSDSITIDLTGYEAGAYKLFDYTGSDFSGIDKSFYESIIGTDISSDTFYVVDGDLYYDYGVIYTEIYQESDFDKVTDKTELIAVKAGVYNNNIGLGAIETTIEEGLFKGTVSGGSVYNSNDYRIWGDQSGVDTDLTIEGGTFNKIVMGADRIDGQGTLERIGNSNLTISGGTFKSQVVGGMAYVGTSAKGQAILSGNINLTIEGGNFQSWIYGGNISTSKYSTRTVVAGDITVTVDSSVNEVVFEDDAHIVAGSYQFGTVEGDTKVVFTGLSSNLKMDEDNLVWGGSSSDLYITDANGNRTFQTTISGDRVVVFDSFTGDFSARIRGFNAFEIVDGSAVNILTGSLSDIEVWNFDTESVLTGTFGNNFDGDKLSVDVANWDNNETTLFSGNITGYDQLEKVVLGGETAAWDASISAYVSDNYKLTFDTVNNEIKFATLA